MISVVTITFNNFEELKKTLMSISGIQEIESVVINGGSSSDSLLLLKDHRGVVINEKDDGIADAFNKGYQRSTGIAVGFLNSGDVLIDREYYSWAERTLLDHPDVDFTYSDIVFDDSTLGPVIMRPVGKTLFDLGRGMPIPHPSMVVRKEVFDRIGGFSKDFKIAMDYDFLVRMLKAGFRGMYYPHATVQMDGRGVSSAREGLGIEECRLSLIRHGVYRSKIKRDFFLRLSKYRVRFWIENCLGNSIFRFLKKLKRKMV